MTNVSWIGPLVKGLFQFGNTYENAQTAKGYQKLAQQAEAQQAGVSGDLKNWGTDDWNHTKNTYMPAEDAVVARANTGFEPQTDRATSRAASDDARGLAEAVSSNNENMASHGLSPLSGKSIMSNLQLNDMGAAKAGTDVNVARTNEQNRVDDANWNNRLALVRGAKSTQDDNAKMMTRASDMLNLQTRRNAGLADNYSNAATQGLNDVGNSIGQLAGYAGDKWGNNNNTSPSPGYSDGGNYGYVNNPDGSAGFADGGMIVGPGSGISDSIPAVIDGQAPAAVSNGEYRFPAHVVAKIGRHKLDAMRAAHHKPVRRPVTIDATARRV